MGKGVSAVQNNGEPKSVGELQAAAFGTTGPTGKGAFGDMKGNEGRIQVCVCKSVCEPFDTCICVCHQWRREG